MITNDPVYKQGQILPPLRANLVQADGSPVPLSGANRVDVHLKPPSGPVRVKTCTIEDLTTSEVEAPTDPSDNDIPGLWSVWFSAWYGTEPRFIPNQGVETYVVEAHPA